MFEEFKKIKGLNKQMRNVENFEKAKNCIKPMVQKRNQTLVLDIEDSLISKVEVQNPNEL